MFLHVSTGAYPLTAAQIIARHPDCSFPVPFSLPDGYDSVQGLAAPLHNPMTHKAVELSPVKKGGGWVQVWSVVALTAAESLKHQAERAGAFAQAKAALLAVVNAEYERRTAAISAKYPGSERESWPVQTGEARALMADPQASTPWMDAASAARGIDRTELAQRIVVLDNTYRAVHGALTGTRQRLEDAAGSAQTLAQLMAIDPLAGWPE